MTKNKRYVPDPTDVATAVEYLEKVLDPKSTVYDIGRITNDEHALHPRGQGFGIMLKFWYGHDDVAGKHLQRFWEKAGDGVSCYEAAMRSVERLSQFQEQLAALSVQNQ